MSVHGGTDLVRDKLMFCFDPISKATYPGSGTKANDLFGKEGTIGGSPTFNQSVGYMTLNGNSSDDFVTYDDSSDFTFATGGQDEPMTIECWYRHHTHVSGHPNLIGKGQYNHGSFPAEWVIRVINSQPYWILHRQAAYIGRYYNVALTADTWYYMTFTYDGSESSSGMKVYYNLAQVDNASNNGGGSYTGMTADGAKVTIGSYGATGQGGATATIDGDVGPIRIYNKVLTLAEMTQNFNAQRGRFGV